MSLETRSMWIPKMILLSVGVSSAMVLSMQSQPADKVQEVKAAQEQSCQGSSNKLSPIVEAWRSSQDVKELENALNFCETIRQSRLANPQCREVYLRAIQFVLDVPPDGDSDRTTAIVKIQKTAARMLMGDDLNQIPAADRQAHRAEIMKKIVLFAKQLRDKSASLEKEEPFYLNVAPPANSGQPTFSGQNPDAIKDPVKRQEYLDALKANQNRRYAAEKRERLSAALNDQTQQIERYVLRNYPPTPDAAKEIQEYLELGGFEKQKIQTLLNKISAKDSAHK